jgi:hypothetical protein
VGCESRLLNALCIRLLCGSMLPMSSGSVLPSCFTVLLFTCSLNSHSNDTLKGNSALLLLIWLCKIFVAITMLTKASCLIILWHSWLQSSFKRCVVTCSFWWSSICFWIEILCSSNMLIIRHCVTLWKCFYFLVMQDSECFVSVFLYLC